MKKFIAFIMIAYWCGILTMEAQTYSPSELRAWSSTEAVGDLDKDGVKDLVIIATPDFKENFIVDDGDTLDANVSILAIFKGKKDGSFAPWRQYDEALPPKPGFFQSIDFTLDINDRGVLTVGLDYFSSAGSWASTNCSFVYRFQNGDFYLIGEDNNSYMRNSGEADNYSYNYLTHKKQHVKFNVFNDKVKPRETWSNLPRKPLKRLGSFVMESSEM